MPGEVKQETPVKTTVAAKAAKDKTKPGSLVLNGVNITHPDRVISQTGQITKGELAEYYAGVAPLILPHIINRPLSLLRCRRHRRRVFLSAQSRQGSRRRYQALRVQAQGQEIRIPLYRE